jgi:2-haloacid dehalogenase
VAERWASFDCYGTLVDWEAGIGGELARLWPGSDAGKLLARFHELEPRVQSGRSIPYRRVLGETLSLLAGSAGLVVPEGRELALADSLPAWPVFPEVPPALNTLRDRGWRLAILSNTDRDLLDASVEAIGVPFDLTVTAADAGSYKPAPGHWRRFREDAAPVAGRHVHVAASLFHDIEPAAGLGLAAVWINRKAESSRLPRAAELRDLTVLPDTLDGLVPG